MYSYILIFNLDSQSWRNNERRLGDSFALSLFLSGNTNHQNLCGYNNAAYQHVWLSRVHLSEGIFPWAISLRLRRSVLSRDNGIADCRVSREDRRAASSSRFLAFIMFAATQLSRRQWRVTYRQALFEQLIARKPFTIKHQTSRTHANEARSTQAIRWLAGKWRPSFPLISKIHLAKANKMLKAEEGAEQQWKVGHWWKKKEKNADFEFKTIEILFCNPHQN